MPGRLGAHSGERADGLLQRFQLLVWPDAVEFEYTDRYPDADSKRAAAELFERTDTFGPYAIGDDPPFIRLGDAAQGLFIEWYEHFMRERRAAETGGEVAPLAAHFGKYPGLVGKLALILHVADDPGAREVSERTMLKALAWIEYLTPHARRVYHVVSHPETGAAELLLARLKRGELPQTFKAWEIAKKGWHGLTDIRAIKRACRLLFEYGWLIELDSGGVTGGATRRSRLCRVTRGGRWRMKYLARLREKEKCLGTEPSKPRKGFSRFTRFPNSTGAPYFSSVMDTLRRACEGYDVTPAQFRALCAPENRHPSRQHHDKMPSRIRSEFRRRYSLWPDRVSPGDRGG